MFDWAGVLSALKIPKTSRVRKLNAQFRYRMPPPRATFSLARLFTFVFTGRSMHLNGDGFSSSGASNSPPPQRGVGSRDTHGKRLSGQKIVRAGSSNFPGLQKVGASGSVATTVRQDHNNTSLKWTAWSVNTPDRRFGFRIMVLAHSCRYGATRTNFL